MQQTQANANSALHIIASVAACLQHYTKQQAINTLHGDDDAYNVALQDATYIVQALQQFCNTRNAEELQDAVLQQDTYVREFYLAAANTVDSVMQMQYEDE